MRSTCEKQIHHVNSKDLANHKIQLMHLPCGQHPPPLEKLVAVSDGGTEGDLSREVFFYLQVAANSLDRWQNGIFAVWFDCINRRYIKIQYKFFNKHK